MAEAEARKLVAKNRRASFDYSIEETIECGIVLLGTEVKSIKNGQVSFTDAFAVIERGEVYLRNLGISAYAFAGPFKHDPERIKKLLLHAQEIKRLRRKVEEKGFTLVPLGIFLKHGLVKVDLGLCKGKKTYDKRADIKERDQKRELAREFRERNAR
jgi:SsrA-binding protein